MAKAAYQPLQRCMAEKRIAEQSLTARAYSTEKGRTSSSPVGMYRMRIS